MAQSDTLTEGSSDNEAGEETPGLPGFDAAAFDVPAYDAIRTDADLIAYSRAYMAVVIAHYDMDIDADHIVDWEVSHRAKRRAACVEKMDLSELTGRPYGFLWADPEWVDIAEEYSHIFERLDVRDHPKDVTVSITWDAFEAFDEAEWRETIRHEAIHIEQFHQHGSTDHSLEFEARAEDLDTDIHCKQFTDYKYPFECPNCGGEAGGRHRESKAVKFARLSPEEQQEWVQDGKTWWTSNCCDAYVTLAE